MMELVGSEGTLTHGGPTLEQGKQGRRKEWGNKRNKNKSGRKKPLCTDHSLLCPFASPMGLGVACGDDKG